MNRSALRPLALLLSTAVFAGLASASPAEQRDAEAVTVAERALAAMGSEEEWASARHLRFEFFGSRLHHWDRWTGRHRVEGATGEGQEFLVLHDLEDRVGRAWVDGAEVSGDELATWLERAHGMWINDTYWLLMPAKMLDPGVHLAWEGEEEIDGRLHDRVRLSFEEVGLTPGDRYWAWVDREDGRMNRWAYHLEDWEQDREPTAWDWKEWDRHGSLTLSSLRVRLEDGREARLDRIGVFEELPDAVYEDPSAVALPEP